MRQRPAAVAGSFYPDQPDELKIQVDALLESQKSQVKIAPKALIVPHAGFIYSGHAAAAAYHQIRGFARQYTRVVLLGPAHRVAFYGMALSSASTFATPLGNMPLAEDVFSLLGKLPQVRIFDAAHDQEHSLEVQLPFLQICLNLVELVPVVVGESEPDEVVAVLEALWGGPETLILASTDLSHFLPYEQALNKDSHTNSRILNFSSNFSGDEACGCRVLNGFLMLAQRKGMRIELLALENSGDTAGDRSRVVGYGAYALH